MPKVLLPRLKWVPTDAHGSRAGHAVSLVVVHRWGVRYTTPKAEAKSYLGTVNYFKNPKNEASAHIVYPGTAVNGGSSATQMVKWSDKAWAEAGYNPIADEIESADAIWLGFDPHGLHVLARMVAKRLKVRDLPPVWLRAEDVKAGKKGFCRHADLGAKGGGHTSCPTTDLDLFKHFADLVRSEYKRGHFRPRWGR